MQRRRDGDARPSVLISHNHHAGPHDAGRDAPTDLLGRRASDVEEMVEPLVRVVLNHADFVFRWLNLSPDHVASTAQILKSTKPCAKPVWSTKLPRRSLRTTEVFFDHMIQMRTTGVAAIMRGTPASSSRVEGTNQRIRSQGGRSCSRNVTFSGTSPSVRSKVSGALMSATLNPALIPSFFESGVPE